MTNDLRKNIARNMRYAQMNDMLDAQIRQLQSNGSPEAQTQINNLKQQRDANYRQMQQPMSAQEYAEYDDYGRYLGNQTPQYQPRNFSPQQSENDLMQKTLDGMSHTAHGVSLNWSDKMLGVIGGVGEAAANGLWRMSGHSANGENMIDAFKQGYQKYHDYAQQKLQNGYERNPKISSIAELGGNIVSPIKLFKPKENIGSLGKFVAHPEEFARARWRNSIGTGIIEGAGNTEGKSLGEYAENIGMGVLTNAADTKLGNKLFGSRNNMYQLGRGIINGSMEAIPMTYSYFKREDEDEFK